MSHFTVLVIGEDVEDQLAPFHEFECTGHDDQHVQEVNQTDDAWTEYCKRTDALVREDAEHEWVSRFAPVCFREPSLTEATEIGPLGGTGGNGKGLSWWSHDWDDGRGYRLQIHEVPTGWEEAELPTSEQRSFPEFCVDWYGHGLVAHDETPDTEGDHKYGYTLVDEVGAVVKTVRRTNPNAHWDWYLVGGRWTGFFLLKDGGEGEVGEPGIQTREPGPGRVDSALKGDVDIETMRVAAGADAGALWDDVHRVIAGREFTPWTAFIAEMEAEKLSHKEAATGYNEQPAVKDVMAWAFSEKRYLAADSGVWTVAREDYVQRARDRALSVHAVIKNGTWHERGAMGSWAVVSDEVDPQEWETRLAELLDSLPDGARLTIVDCHI